MIRKFILNKKINIAASAIFAISALFLWFSFETKCFGVECDPVLRDGLIVPFFWLLSFLAIFFALFIFFTANIFHTWLRHIAWWYLPLLLFAILSTPIYSGNVLSFDRSQIAFGGVVLLAFITLPYVVWRLWRQQTQRSNP